MTVTEKVAYIKGLAEGLDLGEKTKEAKLFKAIIDALDDIALQITDMDERLDVIDEDLADVEDLVFEDDDDYYDDDDYDLDDDDDDVYEFECPNCHETVFFDDSIFDSDEDFELECPNCHAKLDSVFEFEDEDEENDDK